MGHLGAVLGHLGTILGHFGAILGHLGAKGFLETLVLKSLCPNTRILSNFGPRFGSPIISFEAFLGSFVLPVFFAAVWTTFGII